MKPLILAIATALTLSTNGFAQTSATPATAQQKQAIAVAALQDPMIRAAVKYWTRLGARCTHEVTSADTNGGFEMRVDCQMPDNKYFGGGSTMYFLTGIYFDHTALLDNIKIDRAG